MIEQAIKACPFCGTSDKLEVRRPMQVTASNFMAVWCDRCEILGPSGDDYRRQGHGGQADHDARWSAIHAWNRRNPS